MLSVGNKPIMHNAVMLNVVALLGLNVVRLNVAVSLLEPDKLFVSASFIKVCSMFGKK
jgi:hypothetical protein